jgi:poly-gamma-glutamate synthesis protein (capsule biosynthesis protein)
MDRELRRAAALIAVALSAGCAPKGYELVLGGDVLLGRVTPSGERKDIGGADPFGAALPLLRSADLALVNLESPLCTTATVPGRHRLAADPGRAAQLADAGIDGATLANNHALDCGPDGHAETVAALLAAGVAPIGAAYGDPGTPVIFERGGIRVAVLAATDRRNRGIDVRPMAGLWVAPERLGDVMEARVRAARAQDDVDLVVVSLHWGIEGAPAPEPAQVDLARRLARAGADVVWGHHPHALQPAEWYDGAVVLYSTGDLVSDVRASSGGGRALFQITFRARGARLVASELQIHPIRPGGPER